MSRDNRSDKLLFAGGFLSLKELELLPNSDSKNNILAQLEIAKRDHNPNPDYGQNGSRFTDEHLKTVGGSLIVYPLEWMADYILLEHKTGIDNNDENLLSAFSYNLKSHDLYYLFMYMKPHWLGLWAYTVLNTKNEDVFNFALCSLDLYQKYYVACKLNDRDDLQKQVGEHEQWLKSLN